MPRCCSRCNCFFFFQAEDGIRDKLVTGVQTCALPISCCGPNIASTSRTRTSSREGAISGRRRSSIPWGSVPCSTSSHRCCLAYMRREPKRSEEHTSELQSLAYLVCRLLLEKKKKKIM